MGGQITLPASVLDIISAAVSQAVQQTRASVEATPPPKAVNHFKATEKLLYNYPKLKRLIADKEGYTQVQERSKSIVLASSTPTYKSSEDVQEQIRERKESQFERTLSEFRRLDEIIHMHEGRKEFDVIRMYYFNEDIGGNELEPDAKRNTFMDIALDLEREEKTVRTWRNNLVNDIAVCLFGIEAALGN